MLTYVIKNVIFFACYFNKFVLTGKRKCVMIHTEHLFGKSGRVVTAGQKERKAGYGKRNKNG